MCHQQSTSYALAIDNYSAALTQTSVIEKSLALNQLPDSDDTVNLLAAWYPNKTATVSRTLAPGAGGLGLAYGHHKITFRADSIIKSRSQVFKVSTGGMNAITFNRAFPPRPRFRLLRARCPLMQMSRGKL